MKRRLLHCTLLSSTLFLLISASPLWSGQAKYVFFFLGDGMATAQIQATEAYLTCANGDSASTASDLMKSDNRLHMSTLPVLGMQTTYAYHSLITDSAAAATAFACGLKTRNGVLCMDPTGSTRYKSIAQLAHEAGKQVGIISSVFLDDATPAAYYASVENRDSMNAIATQMAESDYAFFGGGGLAASTDENGSGDTGNDVWQQLAAHGYTVLSDRDAILNLKNHPLEKVFCSVPWPDYSVTMPYAVDRPTDQLTLAEMTEVAIANLQDGENGFFIMVEGGKIDWACHANDAKAAIGDILAFDNAVGKSLEFYNLHPSETLIVVTGDHETGGMSIGHAATATATRFEWLLGQTVSHEFFRDNQWIAHKTKWAKEVCANEQSPANWGFVDEMLQLMKSVFALQWEDLSSYQQEKIAAAYFHSLCDATHGDDETNRLLYGHYEPIIVTINHVISELAGIGWTTYSHTGVPVPLFAQGEEAGRFAGFYDNTEIAKKLARAMGLSAMPVQR